MSKHSKRFADLAERARRSGYLLVVGLHAGPPEGEGPWEISHGAFQSFGRLDPTLDAVAVFLGEVESELWGEDISANPVKP